MKADINLGPYIMDLLRRRNSPKLLDLELVAKGVQRSMEDYRQTGSYEDHVKFRSYVKCMHDGFQQLSLYFGKWKDFAGAYITYSKANPNTRIKAKTIEWKMRMVAKQVKSNNLRFFTKDGKPTGINVSNPSPLPRWYARFQHTQTAYQIAANSLSASLESTRNPERIPAHKKSIDGYCDWILE